MLPELDVARVRKWAHDHTPPEFRHEMLVEVEETPRGLILHDARPPWDEKYGPEWIRTPFARLLYVNKRREWTLHWADRNSKFHRYELAAPTPHIGDILTEIDADPTNIFWG